MMVSVCLCKLVYCFMGALRLTIKSFSASFSQKRKFFTVFVLELVLFFALLFLISNFDEMFV